MSQSEAASRVSEAVAKLRLLVRDAPTEDVVGRCIADNLAAANGTEPEFHLSSPAKQQAFLLSLFLSTPIPYVNRRPSRSEWEEIYDCLQDAFFVYMDLYWPTPEEMYQLPSEWHDTRQVSMSAFLHYFNTGLLASVEQIKRRIDRYVKPFDEVLEEAWGLTSSEALRISAWIQEQFAAGIAESSRLLQELTHIKATAELLAAERGLPSTAAPQIAAQELDFENVAARLYARMDAIASVRPSVLKAEFPSSGVAYARHFFTARGKLPNITYPTEELPWESKVGVYSGQDRVLIPSVNALYSAILVAAERELSEWKSSEAYHRHRDRQLEEEVAEIFERLLPNAERYRGTYETDDQHYEHDLVLVEEGVVFCVEVKAAPPVEPFRDPDRAFRRLRHAFRSDSGIQHGYEQARRLRRGLGELGEVVLFDSAGESVLTLEKGSVREVFEVVVTRDDFGPLATNLSLLLEKQASDPYPWVVNVLDLDSLTEAWRYLGWGTEELLQYLRMRTKCHGKVIGSDELEFAGYHIRHGSLLPAVESEADFMQLNPSYSDFFDQLYFHLNFEGPPPELGVVEPVVMDLRQSLMANEPVFVEAAKSKKGRGRKKRKRR